ncbi:leucyl aminopeptidase [Streptoalloteichus tenebrarius]|uniref:Probable cytosol aminopeptidase n=1 Tax=Streptoalloteichus tenebrarius (strain ATCC 17920 / DSM 40477 / JCM 4838 / CBS 697.72 / NBRC 16177 / NCIMB 11028 / NRRL B-12390 / A12253. 1 / ISP 5477) TaxID=1933 RepID=A0ABT1HX15_STRSD|nr:leucyl aminopeptidase [Streptoalloteichus tenebrarius]MCP2260068.1 leucyl aminopeptidase [Streptoalloteichus tenebrarius]BFF00613.1 leucyl aminopeptidase [Streptoalloteichus tenebrarius]
MTLPKLALTDSDPAGLAVDAVVIGTVQGADGLELAPGAEPIDTAFGGGLLELLRLVGASGRADEVVKVPTRGTVSADLLVAVGLGRPTDGRPTAEQVRRASGAAARALAGTAKAVSTLSSLDLVAAAEGSLLGAYSFTEYKSEKGESSLGRLDLVAPAEGTARAHKAAIKTATLVAEAVATARDFINTAPNDLYPASFAERAAELGRAAGLEVEVLDEKALRKGGFGGILGVGGGSARPPRLVRMAYRPAKAKKKVALVGKGITFDTGGISIKPAANMDEMTSDMSGAAVMVASVVLAAKLKLPLEVVATVPMAENMPSGSAYRPGDVLTMYGGKTVEVLNTDAEGRLILSDAIVRACEDGPDYLIETSTLTGAAVVALGKRTAGVMGSDEFRDRVAALGAGVGENAWAMPLPEELRADLDSKLADIANVTGHRWGGMLSAGLFLREFVAEGVQWAHIDVAGPAYNTGGPYGYTPKGGTGVPVRTIAAVLADIAANG